MTIDWRRFAKPASPAVRRCKCLAVVVPRLIFLARSMSMSENGQTFAFAVDRLSRSATKFNPGIELYRHGHRRRDSLSSAGGARPRFDGLFFVGVTSTRIYCRPICTARCPGRDRCRFFSNSALAERDGFRPCLRCRPELAPGHAPVDAVRRTARAAACRIEAGALNDGGSLDMLAGDLGYSARQIRRAVKQEFGVSPIELANPASAPCQAIAFRVKPADHPGRLRQRFRERSAVQRAFPISLPTHANKDASTFELELHGRSAAPDPGLSAALCLALAAKILEWPGDGGCRAGRRRNIPAYGGDRNTPRLAEGRANCSSRRSGRRDRHVTGAGTS